MSDRDTPDRVRLDQIDWAGSFRFVRLFESFRVAIHPYKLSVALLMVVLLWVGGHVLNLMGGARVYPGEFDRYLLMPSAEAFDQWREHQEDWLGQPAAAEQMEGIFETALRVKLSAFERFVAAATQLNFGFGQLAGAVRPRPRQRGGVAVRDGGGVAGVALPRPPVVHVLLLCMGGWWSGHWAGACWQG